MRPSRLAGIKKKILSWILRTSALQITPESPESPYSIDVIRLAGSPRALRVTARAYQSLLRAAKLPEIRRIAGVSPAGEIFASLLSYLERKPLLQLGALGPPPQRRVAGPLQPGDSILLVDGLYKPAILMDAAQAIEAEGGLVNDAVVLVAGSESSAAGGRIRVHALVSMSEVIDYMDSREAITKEQAAFLREHIR